MYTLDTAENLSLIEKHPFSPPDVLRSSMDAVGIILTESGYVTLLEWLEECHGAKTVERWKRIGAINCEALGIYIVRGLCYKGGRVVNIRHEIFNIQTNCIIVIDSGLTWDEEWVVGDAKWDSGPHCIMCQGKGSYFKDIEIGDGYESVLTKCETCDGEQTWERK